MGRDFPCKRVGSRAQGASAGPSRCKGPDAGTAVCQWGELLRTAPPPAPPRHTGGGTKKPRPPVARAQGLGLKDTGMGRLGLRVCAPPHPQVEMLYEEALYTVLYRAGTMGPDQVDDQETLLGYLQQVSPTGPPSVLAWPCLVRGALSSAWRHHHHPCNTHRFAPRTEHTHTHACMCRHTYVLVGVPGRMEGWGHTHTHTHTQRRVESTNRQRNGPRGWTDR